MARYTYKEIGDNKDSDCLTTVIYDGMDIMAIVYDYGEEVEVEPKRDLTDEESDMVKQFCESLDYDTRQKINESISIGENVDILDIYKQAREDFGELNQKSSLNESVKKKPETINEKLKRLDRKVFDEEFKTLDLAYNYSMINEDVVGNKVDMKTKQELRDFINREDDPNKIAKFMDVIINGDDNKKPNQLNNQRVQQSNIRTESLDKDDLASFIGNADYCCSDDEADYYILGKKTVPDSDGFNTEYALYLKDPQNYEDPSEFICIFGDTDLYDPTNTSPDFESENAYEAIEWFEDYNGFEDDDMNESLITEAKEQNEDIMEIFNRNGWTVMKQGPGLMAYNYVIEHDSTIELNQDALINFLENENHLIDDLDALSEDITFSFNATQEGHPTGTVTDWRRNSVEESLNESIGGEKYTVHEEPIAIPTK